MTTEKPAKLASWGRGIKALRRVDWPSPRLLGHMLVRSPQLLRTLPRHTVAEEEQDSPPDYKLDDNWSAHPSRAKGRAIEDANHLSTESQLPSPEDRPCDCFFVHDSCFNPAESMPFLGQGTPRWNAPVATSGGINARLAAKCHEQVDLRVAAGSSCFSSTCRIYAPRYRQVNVFCLAFYCIPSPMNRAAEVERALAIAYDDVARAFVHFVDDPQNADRPFFLAGHSQGVIHLLRLLQDEVEGHPSRRRRFVHGYLTGQTVPMNVFGRTLRHIRPSTSASDICSISSWRTGGPGHQVMVRTFKTYYADSGWERMPDEVLATNPITWQSGAAGTAPSCPRLHKGAAFPLPVNFNLRDHVGILPSGVNMRLGHLVAASQNTLGVRLPHLSKINCGSVSAHVDTRGVTRVPKFPSNSEFALLEHDYLLYHDADMALFHGNIRDNVALRYQAWLPRSRL